MHRWQYSQTIRSIEKVYSSEKSHGFLGYIIKRELIENLGRFSSFFKNKKNRIIFLRFSAISMRNSHSKQKKNLSRLNEFISTDLKSFLGLRVFDMDFFHKISFFAKDLKNLIFFNLNLFFFIKIKICRYF